MWSSHSTSFIILFDPSDSATFFHRQGQNGPTCWTWVPQGFLLSIVFLVLAKAVFTLCVIPGDCQLQDLFLCLRAISKFSVIVRGCLDCFPQMLNLHIFMC